MISNKAYIYSEAFLVNNSPQVSCDALETTESPESPYPGPKMFLPHELLVKVLTYFDKQSLAKIYSSSDLLNVESEAGLSETSLISRFENRCYLWLEKFLLATYEATL